MSGTIHNPIRGLYTKQAFAKSLHKGEDAWLQQPKLSWSYASDSEGLATVFGLQRLPLQHFSCLQQAFTTALWFSAGSGVKYDVFGVFDGHGGKQAANFAAKHVLPILQEELADMSLKPGTTLPEALEGYSQVSDEDKLAWQTQDAMVERLPAALVSTFKKVQDQFHEHAKVIITSMVSSLLLGRNSCPPQDSHPRNSLLSSEEPSCKAWTHGRAAKPVCAVLLMIHGEYNVV